jgi:hypothetical protein
MMLANSEHTVSLRPIEGGLDRVYLAFCLHILYKFIRDSMDPNNHPSISAELTTDFPELAHLS